MNEQRIEIAIGASLDSASVDSALKRTEAKATESARRMQTELSPVRGAAGPRFGAQEQRIRQELAGRLQGERDRAKRAALDAEVQRRYAERASTRGPASNRVAPSADAGLGQLGPARKSRFTEGEAAVRTMMAARIREMREAVDAAGEKAAKEAATTEAGRRLFGVRVPIRSRSADPVEQGARDRVAQTLRDNRAAELDDQIKARAARIAKDRGVEMPSDGTANTSLLKKLATGNYKSILADAVGGEGIPGSAARVGVGVGAGLYALKRGFEVAKGVSDMKEGGYTTSDRAEYIGSQIPGLSLAYGAARSIRNWWDADADRADQRKLDFRNAAAERANRSMTSLRALDPEFAAARRERESSALSSIVTRQRSGADYLRGYEATAANSMISRNEAVARAQMERDSTIKDIDARAGSESVGTMRPQEKEAALKGFADERLAANEKLNAAVAEEDRKATKVTIDIERDRATQIRQMQGDTTNELRSRRAASRADQLTEERQFTEASLVTINERASQERAVVERQVKDLADLYGDKDGRVIEAKRARDEKLRAIDDGQAGEVRRARRNGERQVAGDASSLLGLIQNRYRPGDISRGDAGGENRLGGGRLTAQDTFIPRLDKVSDAVRELQKIVQAETKRQTDDLIRALTQTGVKLTGLKSG